MGRFLRRLKWPECKEIKRWSERGEEAGQERFAGYCKSRLHSKLGKQPKDNSKQTTHHQPLHLGFHERLEMP